MKPHQSSTLPFAALLTLAVGASGAEDSIEPVNPAPVIGELETFVVTASRTDETWFEALYVVESLPDFVLQERAVRSVPEALEQTPGVVVQKTAHGQGSPFIRGWTAYHNLFLIDGIRLNNAAFRAGPNQYWNTVDSQGLRAIELVKSQGSVVYGSDAVGGTLQALTERPYYAEDGFLMTGRSYTRYATAENSIIQRGELSISEAGKYGLIIGGTIKDFGDIEAAGLGRLPFTGYDDFNADGSFRGSRIQGPVGDGGVYHLGDVFLNSSTPLGGRFTLDLGGRYTYAATCIDHVEDPDTGERISLEDSWNSVVGSGRLSYRLDPGDQYRLFGGVSQAFRAPGFSDLSRLDVNRSTEIETPAPGLQPEEFLTFEIGVKANTRRLEGSLSYYFTEVNDLILRTPSGNIVDGLDEVTKQNVGDGFVQGVELAGSFHVSEDWSLFGGFAYQDSQVATFPTSEPVVRDEVLSRLMPINGHLGLRWEPAGSPFWVEGLFTGVGPGDRLNTRDMLDNQRIPPDGTPGYWLATVRSGWRMKGNLLFTAAVENIFDEAYRAHGSG